MAQAAHGSAPDIAGQDRANPIAMILSTAMLLDWLGVRHDDPAMTRAAELIQRGVSETVARGTMTADMGGQATCSAFGEAVADSRISTTPLREALRRLDGEGLIELDAHRNARVTQLRAEEARDLLELRRSLDPLAAALAAERRSTSDLREIQAALRDLAPLPVEATLEQLFAHRRFHRAIYRASHNELLIETLEGLWDKADRYRMLALQVDRGQEARDIKAREHEQLAQFIAAGDADSTRAVMLAHIDTSLAVTAAHRLSAELS
jgi:DNA-binding GntR family transcriptional regulator